MRHLATAAGLAVGLGLGTASAATITGGTTDVTVTADLAALGLSGAPLGSATASGATFGFPITGGMLDEDTGTLTILHDGSGLTLSTLAEDDDTSASVGNFVIDTAAGAVTGDVIDGPAGIDLFTLGEASDDGIGLDVAAPLAGALTSVFGAPDLTGAAFGTAATAPEFEAGGAPAPVPLPASALLLGLGLAGLGLARRRRAA